MCVRVCMCSQSLCSLFEAGNLLPDLWLWSVQLTYKTYLWVSKTRRGQQPWPGLWSNITHILSLLTWPGSANQTDCPVKRLNAARSPLTQSNRHDQCHLLSCVSLCSTVSKKDTHPAPYFSILTFARLYFSKLCQMQLFISLVQSLGAKSVTFVRSPHTVRHCKASSIL